MPSLTLHHTHWPAGVPYGIDMPDNNLYEILASVAVRTPDKIAIDFHGAKISYRSLHESVLALSGYLQQRLDVKRGDRVLLLM
jgi:fatty-acyl-CoA synthase